MSKVQYERKGTLHIGGGRFFYGFTPVKVTEEEQQRLVSAYDLKKVEADGPLDPEDPEVPTEPSPPPDGDEGNVYTESELRSMNKAEQEAIIEQLGGDPSETKNSDERVALILLLQEEQE
ncbi:hypothetical protein [Geomicrobium sp. JCM 19039]|uniref:hypothetical protein n=1 Tax=Geomicrobium sp. JCM 19039 TaxID=1460636 RepID=UPI00045F4D11|nr:hypothetical protein [Geomicrobium sp. JCM 19039]GAK11392.1 hypothetical protein JCM19039_1085 [Geomicrobium sp. JCM 19039]